MKKEGPSNRKSCYGCRYLKSHAGFMNLHHKCKKEVWNGFASTEWHEFPDTPKECPFLSKNN